MAYIIAEIGSNYKSTDDLFKAIPIAKELKVDCFKIQWFSEFDLYGDGSTARQFDLETIKKLRLECDKHEIDFICTAFSPEAYKLVDPFVTRHKIACSERNHNEIREVVAFSDKKYFISLLPSEEFIIDSDAISLMCIAEYPACRIPLERIYSFDGVSDHTSTIEQTITAIKMGIKYLEKHWNPFEYTDTPDACCSINNTLMKELSESRFTQETWTNKYERQANGFRPRL